MWWSALWTAFIRPKTRPKRSRPRRCCISIRTPASIADYAWTNARWVLDGIDQVQDLWRGEAAWWHRVEQDGFALLRGSGYDRKPVVGALAVLAVDAWRVRAALETAARGGAEPTLEAFEGVA